MRNQTFTKNLSSSTADVPRPEAPQTSPVQASPITVAQNSACATPSACPGD